LRERRREKVSSGDAPQHLAARAGCNPGGEERRCCAVDGIVPTASDLMQRAKRQATAREPRVQLSDIEWKHRFDAPAPAFNLFDLRLQCLPDGIVPQVPS
jgi:hypothetical protein